MMDRTGNLYYYINENGQKKTFVRSKEATTCQQYTDFGRSYKYFFLICCRETLLTG